MQSFSTSCRYHKYLRQIRILIPFKGTETFENLVSAAFVDMTTKLNEATFKPLFRRFFDWAFNPSKPTGKGYKPRIF